MFRSKKRVVGAALAIALGLSGALTSAPAFAEDKIITVWADETRGPNLIRALGGDVAQQKAGQWVDGYKVKVVSYSNFAALKTAIENATEKTGPDIVVGANDWVPDLAKNGTLAPVGTLPASLRANFIAGNFVDLSYGGKLYGVPLDINNVAMLYNTKLITSAPRTFGDMVSYYNANKKSKKLTSGFCSAAGMDWGGYSIFTALGGGAYKMNANGTANTSADPFNASTFASNVKQYLLGANGKGSGFMPASSAGCKDAFLAGKVPFAIVGNWDWKDYEAKGFKMSNLMPVPGVTAGTYGTAFGSVSGALLTTFAAKNGNAAGAKSLLTGFFASKDGAVAYQRFEQRPPAHKAAAGQSSSGQKAFSRAAGLASVPQLVYVGGVTGSPSYYDAMTAFWNNVLVDGKNVNTESTKLFKIMKKNLTAKP
jgi:arabinogalactan oligomer / maltooligosaccharide transport system substrate-binding protein